MRNKIKHKHYNVWRNIVDSVNRKTHKQYDTNKSRGITICKRWLTFENWLNDMGDAPSGLHYFKRKNNRGHYVPENCYWGEYFKDGVKDKPIKKMNEDDMLKDLW